jgi:hypothetical protein
VLDDGHHGHHRPHVEHHNDHDGDQHSTGQQTHGSSSGQTATPWLAHSTPSRRVSNVPSGVLGASTPMAGQSPFLPLDSSSSSGRPQGLAANIPYSPIGAGTLGYGQLWRGNSVGDPLSPRITQMASLNRPSGSPFGTLGMPAVANNGANPFLPVGGTPANGSLPPYGVAGQPIVPNSGAFPFLPVGGQPATGNLPPFGIAPSFAGSQMSHFTPIPFLPAPPTLPSPPMLPSPPTLFNPATFPSPNSPPTGFFPPSPPTGFFPPSPPTGFPTPMARAGGAMAAGGFHGGFHGGGGGASGGHR